MTEYTTIRLPKGLLKQVDDVVKNQDLGYSSRAELVKDAVRTYLAALKQPKSPQ
ncbi:MAG: ribbon-helix-helix domain-containing protein [Candidatus Bathyarchaeia archaeon]|jgi:metal-responsive CopG/Arc/MetJ family transcriptional regulator